MKEENNIDIPGVEERQLPEFNAMQKVKRRFFAMRNGDLAQQMKERGASYRINFGLNLPQISEIARDFLPGGVERISLAPDFDMADFARRLRDNTSTRESMLIAPMLFPAGALTLSEAIGWVKSLPTPEVADILCLKLLRDWPQAPVLLSALTADTDGVELTRYCALRLLLNLLQAGKTPVEDAESVLCHFGSAVTPMAAGVARQIREEIDFIVGV